MLRFLSSTFCMSSKRREDSYCHRGWASGHSFLSKHCTSQGDWVAGTRLVIAAAVQLHRHVHPLKENKQSGPASQLPSLDPPTLPHAGKCGPLPTYLAHGEADLRRARPSSAQADLKQGTGDAARILRDVVHVGRQAEAVDPRPCDVCLWAVESLTRGVEEGIQTSPKPH